MRSGVQVLVQVQVPVQRAASRRSVRRRRRATDALLFAVLAARQQLLRARPSVSERAAWVQVQLARSGFGGAVVMSSWRLMLALRCAPTVVRCRWCRETAMCAQYALGCSQETPSSVLTRSARSSAVP